MSAYQLNAPQGGDIVATMKTNMGDIKIKLFPKSGSAFVNIACLNGKGFGASSLPIADCFCHT